MNTYKQIIKALHEAKSQQDNIQIPKTWKLNSDGTYDTNASVKLDRTFVDANGKLKVKFNKAKYAFDCSAIGLTSLEGCPKEVGGTFSIAISAYEKPFTPEEIAKLCKVGEDIIV